jgi:hypothetical protein
MKHADKKIESGKKILKVIGIILAVIAAIFLISAILGIVAQAAGFIDETVDVKNLYSQYAIHNYQLDFYVNNDWAWLPWNWKSGIGKSVMYGIYVITNSLWMLNVYISAIGGYVVGEAYSLDLIGDMSNAIGTNIQKLAGVSPTGFSADGFYLRAIGLIILVVGIYVAYTGLIKRETTKALNAVLNLIFVFVCSSALIAYSPDYIKMLNDFSKDMSTAALDVGTKLVIPDSTIKGKDSVDTIRNTLFEIQIQKPWLILQYGTSDVSAIGEDRVKALVSAAPGTEDGTRETQVEKEVNEQKNTNMSVSQIGIRFGIVLFLFFLNGGITVFVLLLCGLMLMSQFLFIIFALFLPISFLISMIPGQEGKWRQAVLKLFNTIMSRVAITFIITVAFSLSAMVYSISASKPFFWVMILQLIIYVGIFYKLSEIMGMFAFQSNDAAGLGRRLGQRPYRMAQRGSRYVKQKIKGTIAKIATAGVAGGVAGAAYKENSDKAQKGTAGTKERTDRREERNRKSRSEVFGAENTAFENESTRTNSTGANAASKVGKILDAPGGMKDKINHTGVKIKDTPTNIRYTAHSASDSIKQNIADFKQGIPKERERRERERTENAREYRQNVEEKQEVLKAAAREKQKNQIKQRAVREEEAARRRQQSSTNVRKSDSPVSTPEASRTRSASRSEITRERVFHKPDDDDAVYRKDIEERKQNAWAAWEHEQKSSDPVVDGLQRARENRSLNRVVNRTVRGNAPKVREIKNDNSKRAIDRKGRKG